MTIDTRAIIALYYFGDNKYYTRCLPSKNWWRNIRWYKHVDNVYWYTYNL